MVCQQLGLTEVNAAIGGSSLQNTSHLTNNFRDRYPYETVSYGDCGKIFIAYGINDILVDESQQSFSVSNFEAQLDEIVKDLILVRRHALTDITLASPSYVNPTAYAGAGFKATAQEHQDYVAAVRRVAVKYKVKYVDLYATILNGGGASLLSSDGVHPNDAGHQVIANAILAATIVA